MIIRFKQVSNVLYTAQWNGRKITVTSPDGWGPWTLAVDGKVMPIAGKLTVKSPTEAFRAVELAAQNIVMSNMRTVQAQQRIA